jgi:hypothetical protein
MESPFTFADNSIDIIGAGFFALAIGYSTYYWLENNLSVQRRIMYSFIIVISALHIYQVVMQVFGQNFAPFRVWDFINYLTAVFFLMVSHRIYKHNVDPKPHERSH